MGTTPQGLVVGGGAVALVLAGLGMTVAGRVPERRDDLLALGLVVAVWAVAAGFGILAAHATTIPPSLGFLRVLPVARRSVESAAALPLAVVGGAGMLVLAPPTVVATAAAAGRALPVVTATLGFVALGGAALGALVHGLAGRATLGSVAAPLRLTVAVLTWFALVGATVAAPLPLLSRFGETAGAWGMAPLGWSLPWLTLVDPGAVAVCGAVAVTLVLLAVAVAARPAPVAGRADPWVRALRVDARLPLVRVQACRLARHPRTLEALVVAGASAVALVIGAAWAQHQVPGALDRDVVALLGAQVTSAPAALTRPLSDRRCPAEAFLGVAPRPHLVALGVAALAAVAAVAAPGLVLAAALVSPAVAAGWLAALVPFTALAVAVSVALTPELGNGSAEAGAVLAAAALTTALVALAGDLGPPALGALAVAATLAALFAATALERAHRRPS